MVRMVHCLVVALALSAAAAGTSSSAQAGPILDGLKGAVVDGLEDVLAGQRQAAHAIEADGVDQVFRAQHPDEPRRRPRAGGPAVTPRRPGRERRSGSRVHQGFRTQVSQNPRRRALSG